MEETKHKYKATKELMIIFKKKKHEENGKNSRQLVISLIR